MTDKAKLIQVPFYIAGLVFSLVAADIKQQWIIVVMFCLLLVITIIELKTGLILNRIVYPGIALGISLNASVGMDDFIEALLGIVVCGGTFFIIYMFSSGGLGAGILKLGAMIGSYIGWKIGLASVMTAWATAGLYFALVMFISKIMRRKPKYVFFRWTGGPKNVFEFGPFLAFSTMFIVTLSYFGTNLSVPFFWL